MSECIHSLLLWIHLLFVGGLLVIVRLFVVVGLIIVCRALECSLSWLIFVDKDYCENWIICLRWFCAVINYRCRQKILLFFYG